MMTEMTRYKQQMDVEDDLSSLGSARTEDLSSGPTRVRYHMGSSWWRSRTALEKLLLVGWVLLLVTVIILAASVHLQNQTPHVLVLHNTTFGRGGTFITHGGGVQIPTVPQVCLTKECAIVAGRLLASMDTSADPCDDFYRYACGGWVAANPVPDGKASWGTLNKLASDSQISLRNALESEERPKSEAEAKARVFYRSCLDRNNTIQELGAAPLLAKMKEIGYTEWGEDVSPKYDLVRDIINSKVVMNSMALFSWGVAEDDKHSSANIIQFEQGGLTLASRELYLNASEKTVAKAYLDYITKIGVLMGASQAKAKAVAEGVVAVEKQIANFTEPPEMRRDVKKLYHNMTLDQLTDLAPFMNWEKFVNKVFAKIGQKVSGDTQVVVYAKDFLNSISNLVTELKGTEEGKRQLHHYLMWQYVQRYVNLLSDDFRNAAKALTEALEGVSGEEETWRQCIAATDAALGPALGAMYVRRALDDSSKQQVEDMLARIRKAFSRSLQQVPWMDEVTRKAALAKAQAIQEMIGYPDYLLDPTELDKKFKELNVTEDDFFGNNLRVAELHTKENLRKLDKPVNKTQWDMTPPTVNAYYSPTRNDIVFPAGILQPPLFWSKNPQSLNYGAVGVVMGHELGHAFDDQGRDYDKDGNLAPWWQEDTNRRFQAQMTCLVDQYSSYVVSEEHLNGNLTLGENIADNGGLKASYGAYKEWVQQHGPEAPLPGLQLTHDRLFFLAFGQVWCSTMTKERAHLEIKKDPHVPAKFRVLGSLSNFPEFAKTFNCPTGSKMNPAKKCPVW